MRYPDGLIFSAPERPDKEKYNPARVEEDYGVRKQSVCYGMK
jgi:hypothetical protein